jgi:hypothetical protein
MTRRRWCRLDRGWRAVRNKEGGETSKAKVDGGGGGGEDDEEDWTREEDGGGRTFASRNRATQ